MICRGCGGTGLDHGLDPRTYQLATRELMMSKPSSYNGVASKGVAFLRVTAEEEKGRLKRKGPLAVVLAEIDRLSALDYVLEDPLDPAWACEWCNGTGVPQLTPKYLAFNVERAKRSTATSDAFAL